MFEGERLGQVEPIAKLGVDPHRLDSYTERSARVQLDEFFAGTPYQFKNFKKTDGYANLPLDGLWLRAPYLHNGVGADAWRTCCSRRSSGRRRSCAASTSLDPAGGFVAPACDPRSRLPDGDPASTRAGPATASAATSTAPTCRRTRKPTCSPIC